jgi:glycosyltransferase involved in cell wall biosynthesis
MVASKRMTQPISNVAVSVIIPIYNGERYLRAALESVEVQTMKNFEVIAVDDASQDATLKILKEWTVFPIRIIHHEKNRGYVESLNESIAVAQGQFFANLNVDDMWLPNKLATELHFFQTYPDLDVVYSDFRQLLPDGQILHSRSPDFKPNHRECFVNFSSSMARMSTLKSLGKEIFDPHWRYCTDWDLWCRLVNRKAKFMRIPEELSILRIHGGQDTWKTQALVQHWLYYTKRNGFGARKTVTIIRAILRGVKMRLENLRI